MALDCFAQVLFSTGRRSSDHGFSYSVLLRTLTLYCHTIYSESSPLRQVRSLRQSCVADDFRHAAPCFPPHLQLG
jgi:hypothetical protein